MVTKNGRRKTVKVKSHVKDVKPGRGKVMKKVKAHSRRAPKS